MARLFYSSNRSADSYFWEARRLLEDDPALTPRQSFIQAVAGQPARGYERAVLSRGLAPDTFADSIAEVEMGRQSRQAAMQHWRLGNTGGGLGSATPRLKEGVRVQRQPVLDDGEFVWGYGLVTDGHPGGSAVQRYRSQFRFAAGRAKDSQRCNLIYVRETGTGTGTGGCRPGNSGVAATLCGRRGGRG